MKAPILITGCPRSGASMVAGMVQICGAFAGDVSNNMFEHTRISNTIVRPYFRDIKADPLGQHPLPAIDDLWIPRDFSNRVEKAIQEDGYEKGQWMYKSSNMSLVWPVWHYAFPNAKWIIVRRRTGDIIQSCVKTAFMDAYTNDNIRKVVGAQNEEEGWKWWVNQYEQRFIEMIQEGLNCKIIWPERMVDGDYQQIMETMEWLGLPWRSEVLTFIDPLLHKSRQKRKD